MGHKLQLMKHYRCWLPGLLVGLALVALFIILKSRPLNGVTSFSQPRGQLAKMMGVKESSPKKLTSYESISGVLNIQHWVTANGAKVYFVAVPTLPMVDVQVVFDAGAARNGSKGGLAYLTNLMMAEGAGELDANQIAERFENVGAQFHAESQRDMAIFHLRSLSSTSELTSALETLDLLLAHPTFPEKGFKREQQNTLSALAQQRQMPQYVASRAFFDALYAEQPYGNWVVGDEASIKALTVDDIRAFHKQYYITNNMTITLVGDISLDDADAIAKRLTANLPQGEAPPALPEVHALSKKIVKKIDFPSAQTHILLGMPLIKQGDPDYYALYVGNHILGGNGSVTRIFDIVRRQHGLAYSAYSYFLPMHQKGPYELGCQTRNDQRDKALALLEQILKEFIEKGPTEQELTAAKQNLIGGYNLQFDSNSSICQQVAALGFYNLPLDHFNRFKEAVTKLTPEEIKAAYQRRVTADKIAIIMVGGAPEQSGSSDETISTSSSRHLDEGMGGRQH